MTPRWPRSESAQIPPPGIEAHPVTEIMSDHLLTIAPSVEASRAIELATERGVEHLVVARAGGELLGVLCTCDLWDAVRAPVDSVMSTPPVTIAATATVDDAATLMRSTGVGCLPVVDGARVVGVVTRGDLARAGIFDLSEQTCASCGSHHHVRRLTGYDSAFCTSCLDRTPPAAVTYDELGWGD